MTIQELIEHLQQFDANLEVLVPEESSGDYSAPNPTIRWVSYEGALGESYWLWNEPAKSRKRMLLL